MLRLFTLILMFEVFILKAKVPNQLLLDPIDQNDSTIIVSADDFKLTCEACNYDINCINQKYDNKYINIKGTLFLDRTPITSLGNIIAIEGSIFLDSTLNLKDLGFLKVVKEQLRLNNSKIKSLNNLEYVESYLLLSGTSIKSLGKLKYAGQLSLSNTQIENLGNLESVGYLDLHNTSIKSLGKLKLVQASLRLDDNLEIDSFGNLKSIGGDLYIKNTQFSENFSERQIREIIKINGQIVGLPYEKMMQTPPESFLKLWRTEQKWSGIDDPSVKHKNIHEQLRIQFIFRNRKYFVNLEGWESALFTINSTPEEPNVMRLVDEDNNSFYSISIENSKFHLRRLTFGTLPEMNLILKPIIISKSQPIVPQSNKKH